jgi:hypothetical protein
LVANDEVAETVAPELMEFIEKVRGLLKQRIDHTHDDLKIESEPIKVLWTWAVALGAMAYDMSGSSLVLLQGGRARGAVVLNRCIFEYWLRLSYYEKHRDRAEEAIALIKNRFRKILKADPTIFRGRRFSAEEFIELRKFLQEDGKAPREFVRHMLEQTFSKQMATAYNEKYYALASIPVHGNELIMIDVFRDFVSGKDDPKVDYESKRFGVLDAAGVLAHLVLDILHLIERNFAGVSIFGQLQSECNQMQKRLGLLD